MNNKTQLRVILVFFVLLFLTMFIGVMFAFGSAVINWTFDEIVPELTNLGQVGEANLTQAAEFTLVPLNNLVQSFTWITGVLYVMLLIGIVGSTVAFRTSPSRWLMGFFFVLMILLIFGSILMSNIYEDFYTGTDEIATILQEHTILSNLILYSPAIFTVVCFLMGIILFSGMQQEDFV